VRHMGSLRLVGSLKVKVFFAKEPYKRDYILQKRPIILRSLLIVATPYLISMSHLNKSKDAVRKSTGLFLRVMSHVNGHE